MWFGNGSFTGKLTHNGTAADAWSWPCNGCGPNYVGQDNVRDNIDVFVSRTHTKVIVNDVMMVDRDTPDIGFDRAYVYLEHVNYNSCKAYSVEHYAPLAECQIAGNTFHWDNVAYDGPRLPRNSLTPLGSEDVVFNAFNQTDCSVQGVAGTPVQTSLVGWQTWVARLPAGTAVSPSDVRCTGGASGDAYLNVPMGFEVVHQ